MRHAKSSWSEPLPDRERPLNRRGKRAARRIGRVLAEKKIRPGMILSSPARRARSTAKRVRKALEKRKRPPLRLLPELYGETAAEIVATIRSLDDRLDSVLIIGHNPELSEAAVLLSGERRFDWLPTTAVLGLEFDAEHWRELSEGKGKVILELRPRELEGKDRSG
jgi:phosphohistidine phosphatase